MPLNDRGISDYSLCWNNKRCCHFLLYKQLLTFPVIFQFVNKSSRSKKENHSQLSLNVAVYMNYEKFKRSDRPDRFRSLTTVNCQRFSLRCWGKVFQWIPKDWHKKVSDFCKMKFVHVVMYILQQIEWINVQTVEDTRSHTL